MIFHVVLLLGLAAVVTSDPFSMKFPFPPVKCCDHIMCTKDWYPVCAGDTVSPPRTFPNMCELDRYNCYSGNNLEILYNEECKPQKKFPPQCCTKYLPVCAGDGAMTAKSFGNKCLMELYNNVNGMNLKVLYEGECCREKTCKKDCPKDYKPVCAGDGINPPETFCNRCELEEQNCIKEKDMKVLYEGECCREKTCKKDCPKDYKPVCAGDGINPPETFCNKCELEEQNCIKEKDLKVLYEGECCREKTCKKDCPKDCKPVCAGDGINPPDTFCNKCELEEQNCIKEKDLKILHEGKCTKPTKCSIQICSYIYQPVCAGDSADLPQTFPNLCTLENYNCANDKWLEVLYEGECREKGHCSSICCPEDYVPVCAGDSTSPLITFNNTCELEKHNCLEGTDLTVLWEGACDSPSTCPKVCSADYKPVCAKDCDNHMLTFSNLCMLESYNCCHEKKYEILYEGECKSQKECTSVNHVKYEPVCAGDGTIPAQTFSNTWDLKVYNWLNNKNLIVFYDGKCCPQTECPTHCCQNYDPVCASDDVCVPETFSNLCSLNKYNCFNGKNLKVLYKGACQYKDCPTSCTREYKPVCARDSTCEPQTFNNECLLKMFNCENNKNLQVIFDGECHQCVE